MDHVSQSGVTYNGVTDGHSFSITDNQGGSFSAMRKLRKRVDTNTEPRTVVTIPIEVTGV
jgi:hypothetical protein